MNTTAFPHFDSLLFGSFDTMRNAISRNQGYPFYNVRERVNEDGVTQFVIELALAGFEKHEIDVTLENTTLKITGEQEEDDNTDWYYRTQGISKKSFAKEFTLGTDVKLDYVSFKDGILSINLHHEVPESEKPKRIEIL